MMIATRIMRYLVENTILVQALKKLNRDTQNTTDGSKWSAKNNPQESRKKVTTGAGREEREKKTSRPAKRNRGVTSPCSCAPPGDPRQEYYQKDRQGPGLGDLEEEAPDL